MEGKEYNRPGVSRVYLVGLGRNWWADATADDREAFIGGDLFPITDDLKKRGWYDEWDQWRGWLANRHTEDITLPNGVKGNVWCLAVARERVAEGMFLDFIPMLYVPDEIEDDVPTWYEYADLTAEPEDAKITIRYGGGCKTDEEVERYYQQFLALAEPFRKEAEEAFAAHCEKSLPLPEEAA